MSRQRMKKHYPTRNVRLKNRVRPRAKRRAKRLRENPTPAETGLWERLRGRRCGNLFFKRQVIIRGWIVDFWCPKLGLVVEVDGTSHRKRKAYDQFRDGVMIRLGIRVLRVTNSEVFNNISSVLRKIKTYI